MQTDNLETSIDSADLQRGATPRIVAVRLGESHHNRAREAASARVTTWRLLGLLTGTLLSVPSLATAANVRLTLDSPRALVGEPVMLRLEIKGVGSHDVPELPRIPGARITSDHPARARAARIARYAWQVVPQQPGLISIPPLELRVDAQKVRTRPLKLLAVAPDSEGRIQAEVTSSSLSPYVGEPVKLTLRLWLRRYGDTSSGELLSEWKMRRRLQIDQSQWGVFTDRIADGLPSRGREVTRDREGAVVPYLLYEIETTVIPARPGPLPIGPVVVHADYPTEVSQQATFLGLQTEVVTASMAIAKRAELPQVEVRPIPTADRPPTFNGAVGIYALETHAQPTQVNAGDPITLELRLTGAGPLESLPAPSLSSVRRLKENFTLPPEPLPGLVDGDTKLFRAVIRPRDAAVSEIPPIPFTSFDPESEQFVTVHSTQIPVQVAPVERLLLSGADEVDVAESPALTIVRGDGVLESDKPVSGRDTVLALLLGPLLFSTVLILQRSGALYCRWAPAQRAAKRRLRNAATVRELMDEIAAYAARCTGENGDPIAIAAALRRCVSNELAADFERLLLDCEAARYGPEQEISPDELKARTLAWAEDLDHHVGRELPWEAQS